MKQSLPESRRTRTNRRIVSSLLVSILILSIGIAYSTATFAADEPVVDRIIVELAEDSGLIFSDNSVVDRVLLTSGTSAARDMNIFFTNKEEITRVSRLFSRSITELDEDRRSAETRSGKDSPDLNRFGLISCQGAGYTLEQLEKLAEELERDPRIADAHPDYKLDVTISTAGAGDHGRSTTPDFQYLQGYRGAPPSGVNSDAVWSFAGARGDNVSFFDIEHGWWLEHEDLPTASFVHYNSPSQNEFHGTAVLGEIVAQDNGYGMLGIAPNAGYGVINAVRVSDCDDAINMACANLDPGDVYIIELHYMLPNEGYLPLEWFSSVRSAIYQNTQNGYICVEAAGNGNNDLDYYLDDFVRYSATDCGAIMAGSAMPDGVTPTGHSNYGERLDANGWGFEVATTGGHGDLYGDPEVDPNTAYTAQFGGTSSATPMVAGAVISLQSMYIEKYGVPLSPLVMRDLITQTGTAHEASDKYVGPRPNILEAWEVISDDYAPEAIDDLMTAERTSTKIRLRWSAPLDLFLDGQPQKVAGYDIRVSSAPINDANFDAATEIEYDGPFIGGANQLQAQWVEGLQPSTTYYFAIKSYDRKGNVSPLSNVHSEATLAPEPDLEINFSNYRSPVFIGDEVTIDIILENTGSLDLELTSFGLVYIGTLDLTIDPFVPGFVAPGSSYVLHCTATATASGDNYIVFTVSSNDPDGMQYGSTNLECLTSPTAISGSICMGGDVAVTTTLVNSHPEELAWRTSWVTDSEYGPAGAAPVDTPQWWTFLQGSHFAIDTSHLSVAPTTLIDFVAALESKGATVSTLTAISAATLADVNVLLIPGTDVAWTDAERTALSDWVAAGGAVYLETVPSAIMQTEFDTILTALGSSTTIGWDPSNPMPMYSSSFADHHMFWGVASVFLGTNLWIGYDEVELNIGTTDVALISTTDGMDVKIAGGGLGMGRYAILGAPILRDGLHNNTGNSDFNANMANWMLRRVDRITAAEFTGAIPASGQADIAYEAYGADMTTGIYNLYVQLALDAPSPTTTLVPLTLDVHASTLAIQSIDAEALFLEDDCGRTILSWTTSEPATCTVEWGLYGGAQENMAATPLGTDHSVNLPTEMRLRYDATITADSPTCGVAASEATDWKTTRYCVSDPPLMEKLQAPRATELVGAMPNPFNPVTTISFNLASRGNVELSIYDVQGRLVKALVNKSLEAGRYQETWTGRNDDNRGVGSGVYFAVFKVGDARDVYRLVLLK